jgi:hypothetical protein
VSHRKVKESVKELLVRTADRDELAAQLKPMGGIVANEPELAHGADVYAVRRNSPRLNFLKFFIQRRVLGEVVAERDVDR